MLIDKILEEIKKYKNTDTVIVAQTEIYELIKEYANGFTNREIWVQYIFWLKLYYWNREQVNAVAKLLLEHNNVAIVWTNWLYYIQK